MNRINQILNNVFLPKPPFEWADSEKRWKVSSSNSCKIYIIFSIFWKCFLATSIILKAVSLILQFSDRHGFGKLLVCNVLLQVLWGTLFIDFICLLYGQEIIECCNMTYSFNLQFKSYQWSVSCGGNKNIFLITWFQHVKIK